VVEEEERIVLLIRDYQKRNEIFLDHVVYSAVAYCIAMRYLLLIGFQLRL
jgi:hypothetical protein